MPPRAKKRKKVSPIGCLAWFALILLVVVVFFLMRSTIARAFDSSGLAELLGGGKGSSAAPSAVAPAEPGAAEPVSEPGGAGSSPSSGGTSPESAAEQPSAAQPAAPAAAAREASEAPPENAEDSSGAPQPAVRQPAVREPVAQRPAVREPAAQRPGPVTAAPSTRTRQSSLYFVKVSGDGSISLSSLTRRVSYVDSPLADTLKALIEGPLPSEEARGFRSLIPVGTRVENVYVRGDTAFVSFNEPFRFNPFGKDGLEAQLRQVVYTITEFANVRRVQIMIGGKVTEYLGPEGIRISAPLSRETLAENSR